MIGHLRKILVISVLLLQTFVLSATHNRAGEITYRQLSAYTFEITVTTYTYTLSAADRPELDVEWGDNSVTTVPRESKTELPNYYRKNVYVATHTYPGPGVYKIFVQDPNRNLGIENIPNSVNVIFSVSSILTVRTDLSTNHAPVLLNPPYDKAAVGYVYIHNPGAYDEDGDSLSYALTTCTSLNGEIIENYTYPTASNSFSIDAITGDLIWDAPVKAGKYNVAIEIQEWRDGRKIGVVIRDMQIDVYDTDNVPPELTVPNDMCVEVGDTISFVVTATDDSDNDLTLTSTSGAYSLTSCPPSFTVSPPSAGSVSGTFFWIPCHEAVRNQPYNILFKAEDNNRDVNLASMKTVSIHVLAPSPTLLDAYPEGQSIRLEWEDYGTDSIAGYYIYRREGSSCYVADQCTSGLPESSGFVRIGYVEGDSIHYYVDTGGSSELSYGTEYTYCIVAVYPNGTESKPSGGFTTTLVSGIPIIRNVSVQSTDVSNGSMYLSWRKPDNVDTIPHATGPFEYRVYRATGISGSDFTLISTIPTTDLNDTVYVDNSLDTYSTGYNYKIELWNVATGHEFILGEPGCASSVFLAATPGDRKVRFTISKNVPWLNDSYDFFRYNPATSTWDSVGSTNTTTFVDTGLVNGEEYCYYVRSHGGYSFADKPQNLINLSERICVVPVDNEPPCPPDISVSSDCEELFNKIIWTISPSENCDADVAGYNIYFKGLKESDMHIIATVDASTASQYTHQLTEESISGCYAVSSFDVVGNESNLSLIVCIDSCNFYEIPNVFTPNGDGKNDHLIARASGLVEKVDFKLFTRTGVMIFSTEEPKLNWDGKYKGNIVPPGVYFYQCDVFEWRLSGLEQFHLNGFVYVITEEDATNN